MPAVGEDKVLRECCLTWAWLCKDSNTSEPMPLSVCYIENDGCCFLLLDIYNLRLLPFRCTLLRWAKLASLFNWIWYACLLNSDVWRKLAEFLSCCWCIHSGIQRPLHPGFSLCLSVISSFPVTPVRSVLKACRSHQSTILHFMFYLAIVSSILQLLKYYYATMPSQMCS